MEFLSIDFETRSTVDLRSSGVYPYAEHPTTDIICMAYAFGDEPVGVVRFDHGLARETVLGGGKGGMHRIFDWVLEGKPLRAHNAQFERIMWRDVLGPRYGFPVPTMEQWYCSAAEAAAMALPRHLGAGRAGARRQAAKGRRRPPIHAADVPPPQGGEGRHDRLVG